MRIHVFGKHMVFILSLLSPFSLNTLSYTSEIVTTMQNRYVYNHIKSLYVLESHEEILELMKDTMKLDDEKTTKVTEKFFKSYKKIGNVNKFDTSLEDQTIRVKFHSNKNTYIHMYIVQLQALICDICR